jgi:hypothetical protein
VRGGVFKDRKRCLYWHGNHDKPHKLSLTNSTKRNTSGDGGDHDLDVDSNDPLYLLHLLEWHISDNLPPFWKGHLFMHKASNSLLNERAKKGFTYLAWNESRSVEDSTPRGKFGKGYLNKICKDLAAYCKFGNSEKFTGRLCCKTGISKMAAGGVPTGEMCGASRHKSVQVNNVYQARSDETPSLCQAVSTLLFPRRNPSRYTLYIDVPKLFVLTCNYNICIFPTGI